ncbi:MAG: hypothetical protein IKR61_06825 [Lachnospiraceae bacterium]|nr:hypothetical protein [Lachnospiraceae bacterium]
MITYKDIEAEDLDSVIRLYCKYLNDGEEIVKHVRSAFTERDFIGICAYDGDKMVGFYAAQDGVHFSYPHPELEREMLDDVGIDDVYTADSLVVVPEYRGQGIPYYMTEYIRKKLVANSVEYILLEAWIYPDGDAPACRSIDKMGTVVFERRVPMFYKDLAKYGMTCPLCGENCTCGALVQLIRVRED